MKVFAKLLVPLYTLASILLFFYSFTQIDLGLTVHRSKEIFAIQRAFQTIGYFNRPLSALLYVLILLTLFSLYAFTLILIEKGLLPMRKFWTIVFITAGVLLFSYNAFSYDLFNYVFDAKIVTHYHQNPYLHKALDYPGDPMLGFMHWTHRVYPYGPVWLGLTIPLSYLGLQLFIPTVMLFKILMAASYVGSVYMVQKILQQMKSPTVLFGTALFALNPLVIIESLVSAHNDIVMLFLLLFSLYLLLKKRYLFAVSIFLLSVGIKFASIFFLPAFVFLWMWQRNGKRIDWAQFWIFAVMLMIGGVTAVSLRTQFQP